MAREKINIVDFTPEIEEKEYTTVTGKITEIRTLTEDDGIEINNKEGKVQFATLIVRDGKGNDVFVELNSSFGDLNLKKEKPISAGEFVKVKTILLTKKLIDKNETVKNKETGKVKNVYLKDEETGEYRTKIVGVSIKLLERVITE